MPDQAQLRNELLAAWADFGAALGGFIGNLFGTDVDTLPKSQTKRGQMLEDIAELTLTESQQTKKAALISKWDEHDAVFPGNG